MTPAGVEAVLHIVHEHNVATAAELEALREEHRMLTQAATSTLAVLQRRPRAGCSRCESVAAALEEVRATLAQVKHALRRTERKRQALHRRFLRTATRLAQNRRQKNAYRVELEAVIGRGRPAVSRLRARGLIRSVAP